MNRIIFRLEQENGFGMYYSEGNTPYPVPHKCIVNTPLESILMPFDEVVSSKGLLCAVNSLDTLFRWFGDGVGHMVNFGFKIKKIEVSEIVVDKVSELFYHPSQVVGEEDITDKIFHM